MNNFTWDIIDSYFKTITNNLVNHQIDSYNMFVMEQIPKVIRQFNPITTYYEKNKDKLEIIIGGTVDDKFNIINNGKGVYISKPIQTYYKKEKNENDEMIITQKIKQLYPNEARLKSLTYSVNIYLDIYIIYNDKKFKMIKIDDNETKWVELENPEYKDSLPEKFNLGNIPVMLRSKLCVLNEMPKNILFEMGECKYDQGGYFIIDGKEKVLIAQERQTENKLFIRKGREEDYYLFQSNIRSSPEDKFQPARMTKINILKERIQHSNLNNYEKKYYEKSFDNYNQALFNLDSAIPFTNKNSLMIKKDIVTSYVSEGTIRLILPKFRDGSEFEYNIPLFIIFRALGIQSDKEILQIILQNIDDPNMERYMQILKVLKMHKVF